VWDGSGEKLRSSVAKFSLVSLQLSRQTEDQKTEFSENSGCEDSFFCGEICCEKVYSTGLIL
jgi:hypothetical protein